VTDDGTPRPADEPAPADGAATAPSGSAPAAAPVPLSYGAQLAQVRQSLGLSQGDIAARLRLHPRQIAALEQERADALPAPTFVRGFIRNYAKEVRLDAAPLLADYNARLDPVSRPDAQANLGVAPAMQAMVREQASRRVVIGGTVGLLVLFAAIGWWTSRPVTPPMATTSPTAVAPSPAPAPAAVPAAAEPVPPVPTPPAATETKPTAAIAAAPLRPTAAPDGSVSVRLSFREGASWLEVTQGDGRVLFAGMNEPGSERRLTGQPPLRLVVGNASTVTVEYRGKPVDLQPHTRNDGLARLTLD
jgi:cytoskeleton protein RodZ